jgi:GNAT superfamily N-acetyltransferase
METYAIAGGMPRVVFEIDRWLQADGPEHHVLQIDGKILLSMDDETDTPAGTMRLHLASISSASEAGHAAFHVLDSLSETAAFLPLLDDGGDWSETVQDQFIDVVDRDLLIVTEVKVDHRYRGRGLGIMAVNTAIDCFSRGCGLVAIKPFPLQFNHWTDPSWKPETPLPEGVSKEQAFRSALKKVEKHWARLGFRRVRRTDLWGYCPAHRRPSLRQALRGIQVGTL